MGTHPVTPSPSHLVTFYCAVCGDAAATLSLSPEPPQHPALSISGFMGHSTEYLNETSFRALQTALQHQDSAAIYRLNSLWLPCYCPECQTHYCRQHWTLTPSSTMIFLVGMIAPTAFAHSTTND